MQHSPSHIKNMDHYIVFSANTKGSVGRPVKIHKDLFLDFFCAIDPASSEGQTVIRDIEGLKSDPNAFQTATRVTPPAAKNESPKHRQQLDQLNRKLAAFTHQTQMRREMKLITKNVCVYYHINQNEQDKYPTVYISEIQVIGSTSSNQGGLYERVSRANEYSMKKIDQANLDAKTVFISRACSSISDAYESGLDAQKTAQFLLFYNPASVASEIGIWSNPRLSAATGALITELRSIIQQNANKRVEWVVEGEGAGVLAKAINQLPVNLDNHSFKFVNARANLPNLIKELSTRKAQLNAEFINHQQDRKALFAIGSQHQDLAKQILTLPGGTGYNKIARQYLASQITALGKLSSVQNVLATQTGLRDNSSTFIDALQQAKGLFR